MWTAEISHDDLKKYRVITGKDQYVVNQKANAQKALWDEMWQKRLEHDRKVDERNQRYSNKELCLSTANERTQEAVQEINELHNILKQTLNKDDRIVWELLIDTSGFSESKSVMPSAEVIPDPPNTSSQEDIVRER